MNELLESFREAWRQVDVQAIDAQVWTIRNGKLGSAKLYQSKTAALEAIGLPD